MVAVVGAGRGPDRYQPHQCMDMLVEAEQKLRETEANLGKLLSWMNQSTSFDVPLDMTFSEALGPEGGDPPDAYERLIMDVIRGNQTLFMRGDEVEAAWAWTDPIIEGWEARHDVPKTYVSGSAGPADADLLLRRNGREWRGINP